MVSMTYATAIDFAHHAAAIKLKKFDVHKVYNAEECLNKLKELTMEDGILYHITISILQAPSWQLTIPQQREQSFY